MSALDDWYEEEKKKQKASDNTDKYGTSGTVDNSTANMTSTSSENTLRNNSNSEDTSSSALDNWYKRAKQEQEQQRVLEEAQRPIKEQQAKVEDFNTKIQAAKDDPNLLNKAQNLLHVQWFGKAKEAKQLEQEKNDYIAKLYTEGLTPERRQELLSQKPKEINLTDDQYLVMRSDVDKQLQFINTSLDENKQIEEKLNNLKYWNITQKDINGERTVSTPFLPTQALVNQSKSYNVENNWDEGYAYLKEQAAKSGMSEEEYARSYNAMIAEQLADLKKQLTGDSSVSKEDIAAMSRTSGIPAVRDDEIRMEIEKTNTDFEKAKKIYEEYAGLRPVEKVDTIGEFFKQIGQDFLGNKGTPFIGDISTSDLEGIGDTLRIKGILEKMQNGQEVTKQEQATVIYYQALQTEDQIKRGVVTDIAKGVAPTIKMMAEMGITAGIAGAVETGVKTGVTAVTKKMSYEAAKELVETAAEAEGKNWIRTLAEKGAKEGVKDIMGNVGAKLIAEIPETMAKDSLKIANEVVKADMDTISFDDPSTEKEFFKIIEGDPAYANGWVDDVTKAFARQYFNNVIERGGGDIPDAVVTEASAKLKNRLITKYLSDHAITTLEGFQKVYDAMGLDGMVGEVFEEYAQNYMEAVLDNKTWTPEDPDQFWTIVGSVGMMQLGKAPSAITTGVDVLSNRLKGISFDNGTDVQEGVQTDTQTNIQTNQQLDQNGNIVQTTGQGTDIQTDLQNQLTARQEQLTSNESTVLTQPAKTSEELVKMAESIQEIAAKTDYTLEGLKELKQIQSQAQGTDVSTKIDSVVSSFADVLANKIASTSQTAAEVKSIKTQTPQADTTLQEGIKTTQPQILEKPNEGYYVKEGKKFNEVKEAKPIIINNNVDTFVYKDSKSGMYDVIEARTGMKIGSGKTEEEAVTSATELFNKLGLENFQKKIDTAIKDTTNISPRYIAKQEIKTEEQPTVKKTLQEEAVEQSGIKVGDKIMINGKLREVSEFGRSVTDTKGTLVRFTDDTYITLDRAKEYAKQKQTKKAIKKESTQKTKEAIKETEAEVAQRTKEKVEKEKKVAGRRMEIGKTDSEVKKVAKDLNDFVESEDYKALKDEYMILVKEARVTHSTLEEYIDKMIDLHGEDAATYLEDFMSRWTAAQNAIQYLMDQRTKLINNKLLEEGYEIPKYRVIKNEDLMKLSSDDLPTARGGVLNPLVTLHNISQDKFIKANELGGLIAPSVAVTKPKNALDEFGNITLIGGRELVDPEVNYTNKLYSHDVYSPRVIEPTYEVYEKVWTDIVNNEELKTAFEEMDGNVDRLSQDKGSDKFKTYLIDYAQRTNGMRNLYLKQNGITEEPVYYTNSKFYGTDRQREAIDSYKTADKLNESIIKKDGSLDKYNKWVEDYFASAFGEAYIQVGRQKLPYTADNVVDAMFRKGLKAQEGGLSSGVNQIKAMAAKSYKSIEQAKRDSYGRLVSEKQYSQITAKQYDRFFKMQTKLSKYNKYYREDSYSFDRNLEYAMSDYAKKSRSWNSFISAFSRNGYDFDNAKDVAEKTKKWVDEILSDPVPYLEGKLKRVVKISEFNGAIVPSEYKGTKVEQILADNNIKKIFWVDEPDPSLKEVYLENRGRIINEEFDNVKYRVSSRMDTILTEDQVKQLEDINIKFFGDSNVRVVDELLTEDGQRALGRYLAGWIDLLRKQKNIKTSYLHEAGHKGLALFKANGGNVKSVLDEVIKNTSESKLAKKWGNDYLVDTAAKYLYETARRQGVRRYDEITSMKDIERNLAILKADEKRMVKERFNELNAERDNLIKRVEEIRSKYDNIEDFAMDENWLVRMGKIDKKGGAYFATSGASTYYDPLALETTRRTFLLKEDTKIVETNTKEAKGVLEKAIEIEKDSNNIEILKDALSDNGNIDYTMNDEIPSIVLAAKELGYDGIKVWEADDFGNPSSIFLWNTDRILNVGNMYDAWDGNEKIGDQEDPEIFMDILARYRGANIYGNNKYIWAEEELAENFIDYVQGRETFTGKIKQFFDDLLEFIKSLVGAESEVKKLYRDIYTGKLATKQIANIQAQYDPKYRAESLFSEEEIQQVDNKNWKKGNDEEILKEYPDAKKDLLAAMLVATDQKSFVKQIKDIMSKKFDDQTTKERSIVNGFYIYASNEKNTKLYDQGKTDADILKLYYQENYKPSEVAPKDGVVYESKGMSILPSRKLQQQVEESLRAGESTPATRAVTAFMPVIETTGKIKDSRAFNKIRSRYEEIADLDPNANELKYKSMSIADVTAKAMAFIEQYPVEARRVALGMELAPEGTTNIAVSLAYTEKMFEEGKWKEAREADKALSIRGTRLGQEIVSFKGRLNANSPMFFVEQVLNARRLVASTRLFKSGSLENFGKMKQDTVREIAKSLKEIKIEKAEDFINKLIC